MNEARRQILTLVARGEMEPAEAAERLAAIETDAVVKTNTAVTADAPTGPPPGDWADTGWAGPGWSDATSSDAGWSGAGWSGPTGPAGSGGAGRGEDPEGSDTLIGSSPGVGRVRIEASVRSVIVIGDPTVVGAVADGPHTAEWDGDTLVIGEAHQEGFQFDWSDRHLRARGRDLLKARTLRVRMHPDLPLEASMAAGALSIRGLHGPIAASLSAGSARIEDFAGPLHLTVSAGSVTARGRLVEGESRVDCDAGSVTLTLLAGSSVTIRARSELGRITLPGAGAADGRGRLLGGSQEAVIGDGAASLDIRVNMGAAVVNAA
jgi:hypothetical protein